MNELNFETIIWGLFTAAMLYLPLPLIIRYVFKKNFSSAKAVLISFLCFLLVKIIYSVLAEIEFSTTGMLYIFIGQWILTDHDLPKDMKTNIDEANKETVEKTKNNNYTNTINQYISETRNKK